MNIVESLTEYDLAQAVDENLFALFRSMTASLEGSEIIETERLSMHHAFPSNPMFKGVWRTRLAPDEADAVIDETIAWFRQRNAPFIFWWGGGSPPNNMRECLLARGFTENIASDPGMAADLTLIPESSVATDLKVIRVMDEMGLTAWRDVFSQSYGIPLFVAQAWMDATLAAGEHAPWQMFVGYENGVPVANTILFTGAGVASVYGVGVLPEARGRGYGAAITAIPLIRAREEGYRYGVLFSTELGYPVYRRLGFRDIGCTVSRYLLML